MDFAESCVGLGRILHRCCRKSKSGSKFWFILSGSLFLFVMFITTCVNDSSNHNTRAAPCDPNPAVSQPTASQKQLSADLVVLIMTGPQMVERRYTLRDTWLQNPGEDVLYRFVIGTSGLSEPDMEALHSEQAQHSDLLFLPKLEDSFAALTTKLLQMLQWLDQNVKFRYLLKVDDDSFVRLDALTHELQAKPEVRLYWGFFDGRAHIHKSGKYAEKDWVLCDRYIPFAVGGGYILSSDLVNFVASNALYLKKYHAEDVSLGSWLAPVDVQREHDPRFDTEYRSRGCQNSYLVTHKQSVQDMRTKYQLLLSQGTMCAKEQQFRLSYVYNWENLPTECCMRVEGVP